MFLSCYDVGDFVRIKINGNVTDARIIQKGRKSRSTTKYRGKDSDIKVKPIGARAIFVSSITKAEKVDG